MRYYLFSAIVVGALALPCLMMSGCNTFKGMGKDIHDSAQNVQGWMEGNDDNREQLTDATPQR